MLMFVFDKVDLDIISLKQHERLVKTVSCKPWAPHQTITLWYMYRKVGYGIIVHKHFEFNILALELKFRLHFVGHNAHHSCCSFICSTYITPCFMFHPNVHFLILIMFSSPECLYWGHKITMITYKPKVKAHCSLL